VSNDVQCEYENLCNDLIIVSVSDSAKIKSAVILSTLATIQRLQHYASEEGLRARDHDRRSNAQKITSMDDQR
jgi:hypothetical protein